MAAQGKEMSFLEHLEELRWTLVRSAFALVACMVGVFIWIEDIYDGFVMGPSRSDFITYRGLCALGRWLGMEDAFCVTDMKFNLFSNSPQQEFMMSFSLSFTFGLILASPIIIWQVWRFVAPGLKPTERSAVRGTVFFVALLFLLGAAFAYWVLAPMSLQFFSTYSLSPDIQKIWTLDSYVGIFNSFLLWTGVAFELPVIMVFMARIGIVGPAFLRQYRKHAFVVILIVAAIITPPDVVSQIIVTVPLVGLYEISIFLAARTERRRLAVETATSTAIAR